MERDRSELEEECAGAVAERLDHEGHVQGRFYGPGEGVPQSHEGRDEREVDDDAERVDGLDDRLVQPEDDSREETERGGRAEDREERKRAADREGERDFLRGNPLSQLADDRVANPPPPESEPACLRPSVGPGGHGRKRAPQAGSARGLGRYLPKRAVRVRETSR